ncbi:nuclear transport factor 2 family protein [Sorangium sp. So ce1128]
MSQKAIAQFLASLPFALDAGDEDVSGKAVEAENVQRLQALYRAIARGEFAAAADAFAEDAEMQIIAPPEFGFIGSARGRAQIRAAMPENFAKVEHQQLEIVSLVAQGNKLVVIAREKGRHRGSARTYKQHWVQYYEFRNGKIARFLEIAAGVAERLRLARAAAP